MFRLFYRQSILLFLLLSLFPSCSTRHKSSATHTSSTSRYQSLYGVYSAYKKTPYCYGGTGTQCFDCSGFVQFTYKKLYSKHLPRDTTSQMKLGKPAHRNALKQGDLLFFKTSRYTWHVGIYIEAKKFLHASTSKGVTISTLSNSYWRNHYVKARRIL